MNCLKATGEFILSTTTEVQGCRDKHRYTNLMRRMLCILYTYIIYVCMYVCMMCTCTYQVRVCICMYVHYVSYMQSVNKKICWMMTQICEILEIQYLPTFQSTIPVSFPQPPQHIARLTQMMGDTHTYSNYASTSYTVPWSLRRYFRKL